jgi:hypothetical protein
VLILSNIEKLKRSSEHLMLYRGASAAIEQEYRSRRANIQDVAETKREEFDASSSYESLRSSINEELLVLEIITHTPILTKDLLQQETTDFGE